MRWLPSGGWVARCFSHEHRYSASASAMALSVLLWATAGLSQAGPPASADAALAPLTWSTDATQPERFAAAHGRRALVQGYADTGLEVWAYPVQIVDGYRAGFRVEGTSAEIDGRTLLRRITYTPQAITRTYIGPDFVVEERLFVPLETPGALITYTIRGRTRVDVVVHFHPVLDLMWPAAVGGQSTRWDAAASAYVLTEPLRRFSAAVGSREIVEHGEVPNIAHPASTRPELSFTLRAARATEDVDAPRRATVFLAASFGAVESTVNYGAKSAESLFAKDGVQSAAALADTMLRQQAQLETEAAAHYAQVLAATVGIETPDAELNRDLGWAAVALDQVWVTNPQLGSGLVGGYGASRPGRRPQYVWFFAGDAMVAIHALLEEGDMRRARDALAFLMKYQDEKTGMMWHELSQSAGYLDWMGKYPYMFVHVDITFGFLSAMDDYLKRTNDIAFLTEHWRSIDTAYRYCQSMIDAKDGLPHVPANKEAANEQDRLSEELSLSASWVRAAAAYAHLAAVTGHAADAPAAQQASDRARRAVATRYWNDATGFWIDGFTMNGAPVNSRSSGSAGLLGEKIFTPQQTAAALSVLLSPIFQTDWGTRSYASDSPVYDPGAYAKGSVWAMSTARMAEVLWNARMPYPAYQVWSTLPAWNSLDSLGHLHEVLAGDFYHQEMESVPEQTWSSAGFLSSAIEGLLGIDVDAPGQQLRFAPHLPASWDHVRVERLHVGASTVSLSLTRKPSGANGELALDLNNSGPPVHLLFAPEIAAGSTLSEARWNGRPVEAKVDGGGGAEGGAAGRGESEETQGNFDIALPAGESHLRVRVAGGVALVLEPPHPLVGAASREPRVLHARLEPVTSRGSTYTITAAVPVARESVLTLRTPWKVGSVEGARLDGTDTDTYTLTIAPGADHAADAEGSAGTHGTGYREQMIVVHLDGEQR